jgi:glucose-1-phosphatase
MPKEAANNSIENIIFDFGGVIINISHDKAEKAFLTLGVDRFDELFNQASQSDLFQNLETGKISVKEFRISLKKIAKLEVSDEILDDAWNQIIGDYPTERIELLKSLKMNYRLYLLSNTNEIHYDYYIKKFANEFGFEFESLFDEIFWSFKRGLRKPNHTAFLDVITTHKLIKEKTLFIDDSLQNVVAAKSTGLKVFYLADGFDITRLFRNGLLDPSLKL